MKLSRETLARYCVECGTCLHWAQGVNGQGYPQANIDGRHWLVRRYVYAVLMGKPLSRNQPVTSRCGRRLCISPQCLHVTTHGAVLARAYKRGSRSSAAEYLARQRGAQRQGLAKLDPDKACAIRALPAAMSNAQIGQLYGVTASAVAAVRRGQTWRVALPASSVFTYAQAEAA